MAVRLRWNPKGQFKDWRRRRLLARHRIAVELDLAGFVAGERSGTWWVSRAGLDANSVIWSFGVGDNLAWELAMIAEFGLTVHAFDPTPGAIAWARGRELPARLVLHPIGLGDHDGDQAFAAPTDGKGVNYHPLPVAQDDPGAVRCPVRRLATLQRDLGIDRIEVLKIDIEGGEYAVIDDVIAARPGQFLVEFHHRADGIGFDRTLAGLRKLAGAGYRIGWLSRRGLEFALVRSEAGAVG